MNTKKINISIHVVVIITISLIILLIRPSFTKTLAYSPSLIYDTEIENFIKDITTPILKYNKVSENNISIYIIHDDNINAFVTQGNNMFINTGLFKTPGKLTGIIGVIAHEIGHMADNHIVQSYVALKKMQTRMIIGNLIGLMGAVATKSVEVGQGVLLSSMHINNRLQLQYSRNHERAADNAALSYLNDNNIPSIGLIKLLSEIDKKSKQNFEKISPYISTHPAIKERINFLSNNQKHNQVKKNPKLDKLNYRYKMIIAKLDGYLKSPSYIKRYYPLKKKNNSNYNLYANAILAIRNHKYNNAITQLNLILKRTPNNPYILEAKATALSQLNKNKQAAQILYKVYKQLKPAYLINNQLTHTLILLNNQKHTKLSAIIPNEIYFNNTLDFAKHLSLESIQQRETTIGFRNLAIIYGKQNNIIQANINNIKYLIAINKTISAKKLIVKTQKLIKHKEQTTKEDLSDVKQEIKELLEQTNI